MGEDDISTLDWPAIFARVDDAARRAGIPNRHQLAMAIGKSYQAVLAWSKGAKPTLDTLQRVSEVTKTPLRHLLYGQNPADVRLEPEPGDPVFEQWLATMAPPDLTDDERETLSSVRWRGRAPNLNVYSTILMAWRAGAGVSPADLARGVEHTEEIRQRRKARVTKPKP